MPHFMLRTLFIRYFPYRRHFRVMIKILVVEDEPDLSNIIRLHLKRAGYVPAAAYTCAEALDLLSAEPFDLIILDIVLPDRHGTELCTLIRQKSQCPIIFTSCLDDSQTIIHALQSGGDDYMVKPINFDEMLARIEAILRRHRTAPPPPQPGLREYTGFSIDTDHHCVLLANGGQPVALSSIEYELLLYFADHPNTLLLYNELYQHIWKADSAGDTRTVMVHISNLRKKIDPNHTGIIQTVRGAGYIFNDIAVTTLTPVPNNGGNLL